MAKKEFSVSRTRRAEREAGPAPGLDNDYLLGLKASILKAVGRDIEERFNKLEGRLDQVQDSLLRQAEGLDAMAIQLRDVVKSSTLGEVQKIEARILEHLRTNAGEIKQAVAEIRSKEEQLKLRLDALRAEEEKIKAQLAGGGQ